MIQTIHTIRHLVEPQRLLLSWQPRRSQAASQDRMRRIVGELARKGDDAELVYYSDLVDFDLARKLGFLGYPGFDIDTPRHGNVLPSFLKRLPPKSRTDYSRFLDAIRIPPSADISDFALLGYSGAQLPDDDFLVIHPFDTAVPPFEFLTKIQGFRHYARDVGSLDSLGSGASVRFAHEPDNPKDPLAVAIYLNDTKAGYVTRGLNTTFNNWINREFRLDANVERKNGTATDPIIYLYIAVSS